MRVLGSQRLAGQPVADAPCTALSEQAACTGDVPPRAQPPCTQSPGRRVPVHHQLHSCCDSCALTIDAPRAHAGEYQILACSP